MLPEEKGGDEPELEPLNIDHIKLPMYFLVGGLGIGLLIFLLETRGLRDTGRGLRDQRRMLHKRFPFLPQWISK